MKRVLLCVAFALLPVGVAAQDARIFNDVDTTVITVGSRVVLTVTVDHTAGAQVAWPDSLNMAPFEVLGAQPLAPTADGERVRSGAEFVLTAFELGELEIPSFQVQVQGPGESVQALSTDRFGIEVVSVGADESGDIREIRGPLGIPVGVITVGLWLVVLLVLAGIAFWVFRRFFQSPTDDVTAAPVVPPRPVDEVAMEALDRIAESPMLERGQVKEYHIETSEVLRTFVEGRFGVRALEMTTREVLHGLRVHEVDASFRAGIERFLDACDLVKFAKARPTADASQRVLDLGRELVQAAGPVPPPAPPPVVETPETPEVPETQETPEAPELPKSPAQEAGLPAGTAGSSQDLGEAEAGAGDAHEDRKSVA